MLWNLNGYSGILIDHNNGQLKEVIYVKHFVHDEYHFYPLSKKEIDYHLGLSPPHYPMPVTLDDADIAINWTAIHCCQCIDCIETFLDGLG